MKCGTEDISAELVIQRVFVTNNVRPICKKHGRQFSEKRIFKTSFDILRSVIS